MWYKRSSWWAAPFQVSHTGLPDWGSDGGGKYLIGVGMRCFS
jgi:hypothetical protein